VLVDDAPDRRRVARDRRGLEARLVRVEELSVVRGGELREVLARLVGPLRRRIGGQIAIPRGAGLIGEAEALQNEGAVEERLRQLGVDAQRVLGVP
jgi:hypothetical protein